MKTSDYTRQQLRYRAVVEIQPAPVPTPPRWYAHPLSWPLIAAGAGLLFIVALLIAGSF